MTKVAGMTVQRLGALLSCDTMVDKLEAGKSRFKLLRYPITKRDYNGATSADRLKALPTPCGQPSCSFAPFSSVQ